jgi:hypothetical protein
MSARCRLCTTNDHDALIEQLAADLWERHRDREILGPWESAGAYWQRAMREFAEGAVALLRQHP